MKPLSQHEYRKMMDQVQPGLFRSKRDALKLTAAIGLFYVIVYGLFLVMK